MRPWPLGLAHQHDGPTFTPAVGKIGLAVRCGCGWRAQRMDQCRVRLMEAWHRHVVEARQRAGAA